MEYVQAKDTFGVKIHFMYNDYLYYSFRNNWGWSYNHDHLLPNLAEKIEAKNTALLWDEAYQFTKEQWRKR